MACWLINVMSETLMVGIRYVSFSIVDGCMLNIVKSFRNDSTFESIGKLTFIGKEAAMWRVTESGHEVCVRSITTVLRLGAWLV